MALRTAHGTGKAALVRIEVRPPDELPTPIAAPETAPSPPINRGVHGQIADSESAREMGRRGGEARAKRIRLIDSLGLKKIAENSDFAPYRAAAEEFTKFHLASLATQAGGEVGPGPSTMVATAALQLAASRFLFDRGGEKGDPALLKMGSTLGNDSRQSLMAAYEMAVREAMTRRRDVDPLDAYRDKPVK